MVPNSSKAELVSFMVTGAACEGRAPVPGDLVVTGAACEGLAPAPGDPDDEQPAASAAAASAAAVAASRSAGEDGTRSTGGALALDGGVWGIPEGLRRKRISPPSWFANRCCGSAGSLCQDGNETPNNGPPRPYARGHDHSADG
jgi:hypothetical protein